MGMCIEPLGSVPLNCLPDEPIVASVTITRWRPPNVKRYIDIFLVPTLASAGAAFGKVIGAAIGEWFVESWHNWFRKSEVRPTPASATRPRYIGDLVRLGRPRLVGPHFGRVGEPWRPRATR